MPMTAEEFVKMYTDKGYIVSGNGPVLSDGIIKAFNRKGLLIEQPLTDTQLQPNSVDLTLGNTWKKIKHNARIPGGRKYNSQILSVIDPRKEIEYEEGLFGPRDFYLLDPGEFILMASNEILNIPNGIVSFVCGRSSIARLGIQTEQAGFIDSGFRGTITLEVYNQTEYQIALYAGMRVAQVYFIESQISERLYGKDKGSKYNDQIDATGSRIHLDPELSK